MSPAFQQKAQQALKEERQQYEKAMLAIPKGARYDKTTDSFILPPPIVYNDAAKEAYWNATKNVAQQYPSSPSLWNRITSDSGTSQTLRNYDTSRTSGSIYSPPNSNPRYLVDSFFIQPKPLQGSGVPLVPDTLYNTARQKGFEAGFKQKQVTT